MLWDDPTCFGPTGAFNFEEGRQIFNAYKSVQAKDNVGRSKSFQHHFASSSEQQEPRALEKWAYWETEEENIFIAD